MESWPLALPCGQQVAILGGRLKAEVRREKKKEVSKQKSKDYEETKELI